MKLIELLTLLKETQEKIGTSEAFLCGGVSRDRYMKKLSSIEDLDVTTGDNTVDYLAEEFFLELKKTFNVRKHIATDGHISVQVGNLKVDFSSHYVNPHVDQTLSPLAQESWSRDFTCNTLLTSLDLKKIYDITRLGTSDIDNKVIKTCLKPEDSLLVQDYKRLPRIIYMAAKLDFSIDKTIVDFVHSNKSLFGEVNRNYFETKLNRSFELNPKKTVEVISLLDIWNFIPVNKITMEYRKQHGS